jgi:ring-1,2-phenylacetyl-CoA epoxidase subunit PaaB
VKSLDPRVNRLPRKNEAMSRLINPLDQLCTFEVFVQPKEGKPFQHEGAVHAADPELAFVLAKESFTRRFTCVALWVVETRNVHVSPMTEGSESVYSLVGDAPPGGDKIQFEIFHLLKRGKQHLHALSVTASSPEEAVAVAKRESGAPMVYNVWAIRTEDIRKTTEAEKDLWSTLPDKKFRDAAAYKGGDKLKEFLDRQTN